MFTNVFKKFDISFNFIFTVTGNGCVSMQEYFAYHHGNMLTFEWHMFQHLDHNHDGCLEIPDMKEEFNEIDLTRELALDMKV